MPGEFVVRSVVPGDDPRRVWAVTAGRWLARIEFDDLTAEGSFYERSSREQLHLDPYFADLAAHWRGWEGDKKWQADGLAFAARHTGLRHVTLDVVLWNAPDRAEGWRARASLKLEAGTLDHLAREARTLDIT